MSDFNLQDLISLPILDEEELEESDPDPEMVGSFPLDLSQLTDEQLCEGVIAFQYIGFAKDHAIRCMQELASRRKNGNNFNFEDYIGKELKTLPDFTTAQINLDFLK